jgi:hypothetical protein
MMSTAMVTTQFFASIVVIVSACATARRLTPSLADKQESTAAFQWLRLKFVFDLKPRIDSGPVAALVRLNKKLARRWRAGR